MPAPSNDNFADAVELTGLSGGVTGIDLTDATVEVGEDTLFYFTRTVWYFYVAPITGSMLLSISGGEPNSVVEVWTGPNLAGLTQVVGISTPGEFAVPVSAGTTYWISVGDEGSAVTPIDISWLTVPPPANDNLADAQLLTGRLGSVSGTTVAATTDTPFDPIGWNIGTSDSVWYRLKVPPNIGDDWRFHLTFNVVGSDATLGMIVFGMSPGFAYPPTAPDFDTLIVDFTNDSGSDYSLSPFPDDGYLYIGVGDFGTPAAFTFSWRFIHPAVRTRDARAWKWIITDLRSSRVLTSLTTIATEITTSRLLAASWPAALTVPSDDPRVRSTYVQFEGHPEWDEPFVAKDIRALIGFRDTGDPLEGPLWDCAYSGIVKQVVDRVVDGVPQTTINAWDVRKYLEFLPLVDADGNLPGVNGITFTATKANVIARTALENWITNNPSCLAETLFDLSSGLDEDCVELTMTFKRGSTINDVWTQLEQTGAIDIVLTPAFDQRNPGVLSVVNFEVEHGSAQHSAIFSWDRSPRSLPEISRMEDGLKDANTIQDYTDDVEPATAATDTDSVTRIGEYWAMRAWPGQPDLDAVAAFAAEEILFRKDGQTTVTASPAAPRSLQPVQEYDIGDRVPVYASERLRKPIASTMRIYGIPFKIDESARETVAELVVSADAVA